MLPFFRPFDEIRDDPLRVGSSIYIITEEDKPVCGREGERLEKPGQLIRATVDIPDDITPHSALI